MHDRLIDLLEKLDLTIATARPVVSDTDLQDVAALAASVRARLDYPDDLLIAALAGGTGSGKSSTLNVLAGSELSDVGGVRPTTSAPLAVAGPDRVGAVIGYLRELGINVHTSPGFPRWLVVVDMPDTDSVEVDHRHQVEQLLPHIDVVVWVTDPEKYRDESLHQLIRGLAPYESQMLFVLNQIDRLEPDSRQQVIDDFVESLVEDGLSQPEPITTAANPRVGPPIGVEALTESLHHLASTPVLLQAKLLTDVEEAANELVDAVGVSGVDFENRARDVVNVSARYVVSGERDAADAVLTEFIADLRSETGLDGLAEVGIAVPNTVKAARSELELAVEQHLSELPRFRWSTRRDDLPDSDRMAIVSEVLGRDLISPARDVLGQKAAAAAAAADLALSVSASRPR